MAICPAGVGCACSFALITIHERIKQKGVILMAVKLKLTRMGSKKHPFYRVVAANDETRRDGRPLDFLGYYNPMVEPADVKLDADKVKEWLGRGAEPTDTVRALIKKHMG